jgi:xanthosine utilization system XapX-like protein|tara:strand:+ start:241 stop:342 length:102 start_codon:yes stop_codon:yes gene_type:complete
LITISRLLALAAGVLVGIVWGEDIVNFIIEVIN